MNKLLLSTVAIATISGSMLSPNDALALDLRQSNEQLSSVVRVSENNEQEATEFISAMAQKGIGFLADPSLSLPQRKNEFKKLLESNFDMKSLARFSLGRYWNTASDAQKKEYLGLFKKNVINVYSRRFEDYKGQEFTVKSARSNGKSDTVVSSYITADGQKISVDWRVRKKNGQMRVIDIMVEGVSMATTQRSEFASIIQRGGGNVQVLIDHLKS